MSWTQDQWFKTLEERNPDDPTSKTAKEYIDTALEALDAISDGSKYDELVHLSDSQSDLLAAPAVVEYITLHLGFCVATTNDFYREREIKMFCVGTQLSANHAAGWCAGEVSGHCNCELSAEQCMRRYEFGPGEGGTQLRIKWKGNWSKAQQYDLLPYRSHFSKRKSALEADEAYRKSTMLHRKLNMLLTGQRHRSSCDQLHVQPDPDQGKPNLPDELNIICNGEKGVLFSRQMIVCTEDGREMKPGEFEIFVGSKAKYWKRSFRVLETGQPIERSFDLEARGADAVDSGAETQDADEDSTQLQTSAVGGQAESDRGHHSFCMRTVAVLRAHNLWFQGKMIKHYHLNKGGSRSSRSMLFLQKDWLRTWY